MSVFLPSNGSLVLPPTNRSYGMGVPVRHAAYPVAPGMPMTNMGVPMNMGMQPMYNNGGVHTVVASQPPYAGSFVGSGSTVVVPSTPYHHPQSHLGAGMMGMPMTAASYPGYTYGGSPYYAQSMGMGMGMGQPTTIIVPSSSRRHRRSSSSHSSHSHRRSRSRDY